MVLCRSSSQPVCTLHGPLPVHLLRHVPKARCSPGFSRKDFAVLSTHVLDLAALWIEEKQL